MAYQFNALAGTLTRVSCTDGGAASVATIGRNILTASADYDPVIGSIEVSITARDPEAPMTDAPFAFRFRAYGRLAGSDNGGGGSSSGPAVLPKGAVAGEVLAFANLAGTGVGAPLADVAVTLTGPTFTATRTTGLNGKYFIGTVPAGTYTLSISPATYIATTASSLSTSVTVAAATVTSNFGVVKVGSITGKVGTGPAAPVNGATVTLSGPAPASVTTAADGTFTFPNLPTGSYSVTVTPPAGYTVGAAPHCGPTAIDGNAFTCPDVVLTQATYTVTGLVRTSANVPIPGATVNLTGASTASTTTNAAGQYSFTVVDGAYTVTVPTPTGYTLVSGVPCPAITNFANQICADAIFNPPVGGTITGTVKRDLDLDGFGDIGLANVTITLASGTTTQTLADGSFSFSGVADGTYSITQTTPPGFIQVPVGPIVVTVAGGVATPTPVQFVNRRECALAPPHPDTSILLQGNSPAANQTVAVATDGTCSGPITIRIPARAGNNPGPQNQVTVTATQTGTFVYTSAVIAGGNWKTGTVTNAQVFVNNISIGTFSVVIT